MAAPTLIPSVVHSLPSQTYRSIRIPTYVPFPLSLRMQLLHTQPYRFHQIARNKCKHGNVHLLHEIEQCPLWPGSICSDA
jgi:hypothetical protein